MESTPDRQGVGRAIVLNAALSCAVRPVRQGGVNFGPTIALDARGLAEGDNGPVESEIGSSA
jgi:hypothetical protein